MRCWAPSESQRVGPLDRLDGSQMSPWVTRCKTQDLLLVEGQGSQEESRGPSTPKREGHFVAWQDQLSHAHPNPA